jgi:hypothetical protein
MRSFDIDLRGFSTILQTPGARAPARPDAVAIRGSLIETVSPAHCGASFGSWNRTSSDTLNDRRFSGHYGCAAGIELQT